MLNWSTTLLKYFYNDNTELTHAFLSGHAHCTYAGGSRLFQGNVLNRAVNQLKKMCMQIDQCAQLLSQAAKPESLLGQGKGVNLTPAESEWDFSWLTWIFCAILNMAGALKWASVQP